MARRKAEIDLLGVASKEELLKFEVAKESDRELSEKVAKVNVVVADDRLATEEELLRIKKKGEQEILDVQNELKEFKISEERKISFLPIDDEEEEEVYVPTKLEAIKNRIKQPFVNLAESYDSMTFGEKFAYLRAVLSVVVVLFAMTLSIYSLKKYKIVTSDHIKIELKDIGAGQEYKKTINMKFNDDEYVLERIVIDGQNTVFVFDGLNGIATKYSAKIVDNDLHEYQMDQHYMRNIRDIREGQVLALEPLNDGIREFDLVIKENSSGEEFSYHFRLDKFLKKANYVKDYDLDNSPTGLDLDNITASASGSTVNYSVASKGLPFKYTVIDRPGMSSGLYEDKTIIPSKQNHTEVYDFPGEDVTLFQEIYISPKNYEAEIEYKNDKIFKSYESGQTFTRAQVQAGQKINFGHYTLTLEGLQKKGDMAVLVYTCVDNTFVPAPEPETDEKTGTKKTNKELGEVHEDEALDNLVLVETPTNTTNNIYTYLDVEIVTLTGNGKQVASIKPTKYNIGEQGADIVFKDDRLSGVVNNFGIKINSINVRDSSYSANILMHEYNENDPEVFAYESELLNIQNAFKSRLAFHVCESPRSAITNFSDKVLLNKTLMEKYLPINLIRPASYSVKIITSSLRDGKIYAVVEENVIAKTKTTAINKNVQHKIIYDTKSKEITYDEIFSVVMK